MGLGRWNFFGRQRTVHEATRRAWCRMAFVICGALPVLVTLLACTLEYVPLYQQLRASRYEQQLTQITGLVVSIERVELLTPSKRLLHGLEFRHPETGESIGRVSALWISETPGGCAIKAQMPQIESDHMQDWLEIIHQHVLCRPTSQGHAVVLWMDGLTFTGAQERQFEFKQLRCELRRSSTTTSARCAFERAGVAGNPAEITFIRQHTDVMPTSQVTLNTGDTETTVGQYLPGHWVNQFSPQLSVPGAEATVRGKFAFDTNQSGWSLRGACRVQRVDASSWFDRPVLAGLADVEITNFGMTNRNLNEVAGSLLVQNGQIHTDALKSAAYIGIHPTAQVQHNMLNPIGRDVLAFTKLGCKFSLDARGLVLAPLYRESAMAVDEVGPLAQYTLAESYVIPLNYVVVFLSLKNPESKNTDSEILQSPTVKRLVQWLPGPQAQEARTARAFGPLP